VTAIARPKPSAFAALVAAINAPIEAESAAAMRADFARRNHRRAERQKVTK
jgi:hypothetical protein